MLNCDKCEAPLLEEDLAYSQRLCITCLLLLKEYVDNFVAAPTEKERAAQTEHIRKLLGCPTRVLN